MDADKYLTDRLESEISWYENHSLSNKLLHVITRGIEIICAAIIPLLAGFPDTSDRKLAIAVGVLGILVATSAGFSSLLKFQENWIKYRTTAESLKKEKYLFMTKVEPYNEPEPIRVLVQRVETLVSQENTNWAQYMMKPAKEAEPAKKIG